MDTKNRIFRSVVAGTAVAIAFTVMPTMSQGATKKDTEQKQDAITVEQKDSEWMYMEKFILRGNKSAHSVSGVLTVIRNGSSPGCNLKPIKFDDPNVDYSQLTPGQHKTLSNDTFALFQACQLRKKE